MYRISLITKEIDTLTDSSNAITDEIAALTIRLTGILAARAHLEQQRERARGSQPSADADQQSALGQAHQSPAAGRGSPTTENRS